MYNKIALFVLVVLSICSVFFSACEDNPVKPPDNDVVKIPELLQIEPVTGVPGDEITLTGKNFGTSRGSSYVLFGEEKPLSSDYISWNDSLIKLKIPVLALTGYVKVVVNYIDTTVMSEPIYFPIGSNVGPPFISRIKPDKAYAGDTVTIDGSNFLNLRDTNYVLFHGNKLNSSDYVSWTGSKITFKVPANATPQLGKIKTVVKNVSSNEMNFTVLQKQIIEPPVINYINPSTAEVGDTIFIYGSNFSDSRNNHNGYVVIGGVTVNNDNSFIDWKDDLILVKVPTGAVTGKLYVYKDNLKSNEVDFTLGTVEDKTPQIISFSDYDVKKSEFVDINGKYFGDSQGVNSFIYFGANQLDKARITSWSDIKITIQIPDNATPGTYQIYVSVDGKESNKKNITVFENQKTYLVETVLITAGTFIMGTSGGDLWADPSHQVTLTKDFYMGKYEITQEIYQKVATTWPNYLPDDTGPQKPANLTTWYAIVEWCNDASARDGLQQCYTINGTDVTCDFNKNGYRLPTEAEWEYACRAGTTGDLNFNGNIDDYALTRSNGGNKLNNVGEKLPNPWGLYDMYGNATEWCWDWLETYSDTPETDPKGPSEFTGNGKVVRGGSVFSTIDEIKSWARTDVHPASQDRTVGFRVVRNK